MKVYMNTDYRPAFQAKISQRFTNSLRGYVNNGPNRLKNNYILTQKIEEYAKFGYDNYTIEMQQTSGRLGLEYRLFAVKDGDDTSKGIVLTKKTLTSYRKMYERFMNFNKHDFVNIMKSKLNK